MLNMGHVLANPAWNQNFTVIRNGGNWNDSGLFIAEPMTLHLNGAIIPDTKTTIQTPDGDTVTGFISVYTTCPLYSTRAQGSNSPTNGVPDEILWNSEKWKVIDVNPYGDYGYFKSIAVRKYGA